MTLKAGSPIENSPFVGRDVRQRARREYEQGGSE